MRQNPEEAEARMRAEWILKVRAGVISAAQAAKELGVSRKTYYKWERRGLSAMMAGLCGRNSGRPASVPDEEKERLRRRVQELEKQLRIKQQSEELRQLLRAEVGEKSTRAAG
jgi:transposase